MMTLGCSQCGDPGCRCAEMQGAGAAAAARQPHQMTDGQSTAVSLESRARLCIV